MARKHYDVIVVGTGLGALVSAALLSRRSFRVLLVGAQTPPQPLVYDDLILPKRAAPFVVGETPVFRRILGELAQTQAFRRRVLRASPMFQWMDGWLRFDAQNDSNAFDVELRRVFPDSHGVLAEYYRALGDLNAVCDTELAGELALPPKGILERRLADRRASRMSQMSPRLVEAAPSFNALFDDTVSVATHQVGNLPDWVRARLHGSWTRGMLSLPASELGLVEFLAGRVKATGGELSIERRVRSIVTRGSSVTGVLLDHDETPIGCDFLVWGHSFRDLLEKTPDFVLSERALMSLPEIEEVRSRYTLALIAREDALPSVVGSHLFLHGRAGESPLFLQVFRQDGHTLVLAEMQIRASGLADTREIVLARLCAEFPFLESRILIVDSAHDGRPLWDFRSGKLDAVPRHRLTRGGSVDAERMQPLYGIHGKSWQGISGDPVCSPIGNVFLSGASVLPALGQEGELLAAWNASHLITKTDSVRAKMMKELWTKIEV